MYKRTFIMMPAVLLALLCLFIGVNLLMYKTSGPDPHAVEKAVLFAREHGLRTDRIVLCDFSVHSGYTARHFRYGIFPFYIPLTKESEGCFAISDITLLPLIKMSGAGEKKMLLYAYQ